MSFIGIWSDNVQTYLLTISIITFCAFSLLLFLKPLLWARMLTWRVPEDTDLTVYFGRCLGAFAIVTNAMMLLAALYGFGVESILVFFSLFCAFMVVVHIWGAIEDSQPKIETLETGFWALLLVLNFAFYPI